MIRLFLKWRYKNLRLQSQKRGRNTLDEQKTEDRLRWVRPVHVERERDRQTDRQTEIETKTERDRERCVLSLEPYDIKELTERSEPDVGDLQSLGRTTEKSREPSISIRAKQEQQHPLIECSVLWGR